MGPGGVGYLTAAADARGGHHLLLHMLDAAAAAALPQLSDGAGMPLSTIEALPGIVAKAGR